MSELVRCPDPKCQRQIDADIFEVGTAHALGCSRRRSALAKDAYAKREARRERSRRAAETRLQRRLAQERQA